MEEFTIDFTEEIIAAGCPICGCLPCVCGSSQPPPAGCPICGCLPCVCGSRADEKKGYPGKNVKRCKDGVPQKKKKKRATKKGEFRDKSGKLKKTKADYSELWKWVNS